MTWFFIALSSAILSAFAAITQKKILFNRGALEFSFLLSIANLLLSIPFFFVINYSHLNTINMTVLLVKSIIGVGAFLCVMTALKNLNISSALPLLALTPGFVAVFAFLLLGESIKNIEILGLVFLIAGSYILESKSIKDILFPLDIFKKSKYYRYILLALLLFTASSVMDKLLLIRLNITPLALIAIQHFYFAVLFAVVYLFYALKLKLPKISLKGNDIWWIILISILTIGYRYTQVVAVSIASVALVLAVKRTSVFWATIIGGKIFNEENLLRKTLAVLFIVAGTILILRD
jgi:drug/metabolite transporter (DMT)-like permease